MNNLHFSKINYLLIIFAIALLFICPYIPLWLMIIFSVALTALEAYLNHLKGALLAALWLIFIFEAWGDSVFLSKVSLISQALIFGSLFKYQHYLKEELETKGLKLKREQKKLNQILQTTRDGFFIINTRGEFIEVNQAYQQITGYSKEELLTMNLNDIEVDKDQLELQQHMQQVIKHGHDLFETKHYCKDGTTIDLEISTTYINNLEQPIFVVFSRDITAKKRQHQALQESEAQLKSYLDNAPYGIFIMKKNGNYLRVNKRLSEITAYSKEELLATELNNSSNPKSIRLANRYLFLINKYGTINYTSSFTRKDGKKIYINIKGIRLTENKFLGFVDDITEEKKLAEELKNERNKLQNYFDISDIIILSLNPQGVIIDLNKKTCQLLGVSKEEAIGQNWFDNFIPQEEQTTVKTLFNRLLSGESIPYYQNHILTTTGQKREIIWHNALLTDSHNQLEGILSTGLDITKQKLLQQELQYNQLKVKFMANLSHELKTPLNLIFSAQQMLSLLENNLAAQESQKLAKYNQIIKQNGNRLLRLVNNLLDITKIDSNNFELNLENYDIIKLIRKITASVEDYISQQEKELHFNSILKEKIIACDPFIIERIMLNLLSNAIKFTDPGDQIIVNIYQLQDNIVILVKDTGIGINQTKQDLIFKPFGQADKSFTRNNEGSGMGLAIVKLLVELHDGEITLQSIEGEGSEFIITLPDKQLTTEDYQQPNYNYNRQNLVNRIDIEFFDIYNL